MFVRWKHIIRVQDIQTSTKTVQSRLTVRGDQNGCWLKKNLQCSPFSCHPWIYSYGYFKLDLKATTVSVTVSNIFPSFGEHPRRENLLNIPVALELWPLPKHCWPTSSERNVVGKRSAGVVETVNLKDTNELTGEPKSMISLVWVKHTNPESFHDSLLQSLLWLIINWVASTSTAYSTWFSNVMPLQKEPRSNPCPFEETTYLTDLNC